LFSRPLRLHSHPSYNTPPCEAPMSLRSPIALVLSIVCLAVPAWPDSQAGVDAYTRGDYATALREWQPIAEQGDAAAQYNLGVLYENGRGVPQDYTQARQWWEKAAVQGDPNAQFYLGTLYNFGRGGLQDYAAARQWWEKAAVQGHAKAQFNLGVLYDSGQGVSQDHAIARHWYEKAAAQRVAKAQFYLGLHSAYGRGVPQDLVQAHMWYSLAAENGYEIATGYRDDLAKQMTPTQIAEAQQLAREWKPKTP
jgi:TPR repeat protein